MGRPPILSGIDCYFCRSDQTSKAGKGKDNKQRYRCRKCNKFFIIDRIQKAAPKKRRTGKAPSAGILVLELQAISQRLGKVPTTAEISELSKQGKSHSLNAYYAAFGSFLTALKRARLTATYKRDFDDNEKTLMLDQLRRLSRKLKRPIIGKDFAPARKRNEVWPVSRFKVAFGSVPKAIELAGVAPKTTYTREELIAHLRELDRKIDDVVYPTMIDELHRQGLGPSSRQYARKFGGIVNARRAAGVKKPRKPVNIG